VAIKIKKKKQVEEVESPEVEVDEELAVNDRFVRTSVTFSSWMQAHWLPIAIGVAAVIAIFVGTSLYLDHIEAEQEAQSAALNAALVAQNTPTQSEFLAAAMRRGVFDPGMLNDERLFPDEAARSEAVYDASVKAIENYGDSEIGGEAKLIAASSASVIGKTEEALNYAKAASTELDPSLQVFALHALAMAQANAQQTDEAIETLRQLAALSEPRYGAFASMQIGIIAEQAGNTKEAIDAFARVAARYPEYADAPRAKARLAMITDDPEAIIRAVPVN
jgi:hypothetical protein